MSILKQVFLGASLAGFLVGCGRGDGGGIPESGVPEAASADFERGPHRGRMLREGGFGLELQIFEDGVPPEYHVYLFRGDKPLEPTAANVAVKLTRLDGEVDQFTFVPQGEFLRGSGVVTEPHSFSVEVVADEGGRRHRWSFDSFEGRVTIAAATAAEAGIRTERAGTATISDLVALTGRLVPDAERTRSVSARFPGLIRGVDRSVGDTVRAGDRLAIIESNESLENYPLVAPIGGVVTERHTNPGENAAGEPLFVISNYDALWAELSLFPKDLPRVRPGQKVQLKAADGTLSGEGRVLRVAPTEGAAHGSTSGLYDVRVSLDNRTRAWTPGLFVEGQVEVSQSQVPLAVKRSGLQAFRDFTVVFELVGETYEVRMLELGRQDDTWAEVLGGLKPGVEYVTENSFLIKADIEKSGASHDH